MTENGLGVPRALPRRFFARDADIVARDLIGRILVHEVEGAPLACRIVETEAYFGPAGRNAQLMTRADMPARLRARLMREGDPASHASPGVTKRNQGMYGPPGFAYVYIIYGMHECLNVITGPGTDHEPQAVLLRAGEPVEGVEAMKVHRPGARGPMQIASGPAKLTHALRVTRAHDRADITRGPLHFEKGHPVGRIEATPRVGVVGAEDLPLRFVEKGSLFATRLRGASKNRQRQ
jgi:DNA-3-methyladenine glycosylase